MLALFLISSFGFCLFLKYRWNLLLCFTPVITISIQMLFLFFAGLLNFLRYAVYILLLVGIGLLLFLCLKIRKNKELIKKNLLDETAFSLIFFLVCLIIFFIALRGTHFGHYDNFSHWGLIVKQMLLTHRFPTFQDPVILFQTYPVGSASYIYFFSSLVGGSEHMQMIGECILELSCFITLFAFFRKNKLAITIILVISMNLLFMFNGSVHDLLVDRLIAFSGFAVLLFIWRYAGDVNDFSKLFFSVPLISMLLFIKNSGLFFALFACLFLLLLLRKKEFRTKWKHILCFVIIPWIMLFLWNRHYKYVFSISAVETKHAISLANYTQVFEEKDPELIKLICQRWATASVTGKELFVMLALLALTVLVLFLLKVSLKKYLSFVVPVIVIYILWQISLLFTYIFSMPELEALNLASFDRYRNTIFSFILLFIIAFICKALSESEVTAKRTIAGSVLSCILVFSTGYFISTPPFLFYQKQEMIEYREKFEAVLSEGEIEPQKSYLILGDEESLSYYIYFLCRYEMYSDAVYQIADVAENKISLEDARSFDYLIVYDQTDRAVLEYAKEIYSAYTGGAIVHLKEE